MVQSRSTNKLMGEYCHRFSANANTFSDFFALAMVARPSDRQYPKPLSRALAARSDQPADAGTADARVCNDRRALLCGHAARLTGFAEQTARVGGGTDVRLAAAHDVRTDPGCTSSPLLCQLAGWRCTRTEYACRELCRRGRRSELGLNRRRCRRQCRLLGVLWVGGACDGCTNCSRDCVDSRNWVDTRCGFRDCGDGASAG